MARELAVSRQGAHDPIQEEAFELQKLLSTARVLAEHPDEDVATQAPDTLDEFVQVVGRAQRVLDAVWAGTHTCFISDMGNLLEATRQHALPIIARLVHDLSVCSDSFRVSVNTFLLRGYLRSMGAEVPPCFEYRDAGQILKGISPIVKFHDQAGMTFTLESGPNGLKLQDIMDYVVLMQEYAIKPLREDINRAIAAWARREPGAVIHTTVARPLWHGANPCRRLDRSAPVHPAGTCENISLPPSSAISCQGFRRTISEIAVQFGRAYADIQRGKPISDIHESLAAHTRAINALFPEVAASLAALGLPNDFAYYTQLARDASLSPLLLSGMIFCPPPLLVA